MAPANLVDLGVGLDLALKVDVFGLLDGLGAQLQPQAETHNRRI